MLLGVALCVGPPGARAQEASREITIQNLAPFPRDEWWVAAVPFRQGEVAEQPELRAGDRPTVWQTFGARWPDGSVRQALCMFRARVDGIGETRIPLEPGTAAPVPDSASHPPLPDGLAIIARIGDEEWTGTPKPVRRLESNRARVVDLLRCRVGESGLVAELILERYAGQDHVYADLGVFFSDPRTPAMQVTLDELALSTRGVAWVPRHAGPLGIASHAAADGSRVLLLRGQVLGDAQGIRRTGVLVPPVDDGDGIAGQTLLAAAVCPPLAATSWSDSGAYGPFGYAPPPPPWLPPVALRAAMASRHRAFVAASRRRGDPFANFRFGPARRPADTGDQEDFGVVKLEPVAGTGLPSFLLEVELSVLQEACRPVHAFEADTSPVRSADHPDWVVWNGRAHWHCEMSKDRLGKPCPEPPRETHGWSGKDRQHWSSNYLCGFYLLTGKHWALREIENEVQLYLAGQTIRPELSTSHSGAPRGAGRTMLAACWLYLCTGDAALLQRMHDRVDRIHHAEWAGRDLAPGKVRTFHWRDKDARMLQGKVRYWNPWEDNLAVLGFEAFWRMAGNERARDIARAVSLSSLRHGWRMEGPDAPIIATAIRWNEGGEPVTRRELDSGDPTVVLWSHGTGLSVYAVPAVEIARQYAVEDGDTELQEKAEKILAALRGRRRMPPDRWYDRFGQWDAVR